MQRAQMVYILEPRLHQSQWVQLHLYHMMLAQELLRHASRLPLPRDLVCEITARVVKSETWWMLEGRGAGGLRAATCSEAAA